MAALLDDCPAASRPAVGQTSRRIRRMRQARSAMAWALGGFLLLQLGLIIGIDHGTPEFREAIRQALLTERDIAASQGVYNFTEKDRYGLDERSRILLTVKDGKYVLAKPE